MSSKGLPVGLSGPVAVPRSHRVIASPQILNPSESILSNLQSALSSASQQLAARGSGSGTFSLRDMDTLAKVVTAATKLAAELRESAKATSLALSSDADVLQLVLDSCRALGDRGTAILLDAIKQLASEQKDESYDSSGSTE